MKIQVEPKHLETIVSKQKRINKVKDEVVLEAIHEAIRKLVKAYPNWEGKK